jgi:hypothetical protein
MLFGTTLGTTHMVFIYNVFSFQLTACLRDLERHFNTDPTETVATPQWFNPPAINFFPKLFFFLSKIIDSHLYDSIDNKQEVKIAIF